MNEPGVVEQQERWRYFKNAGKEWQPKGEPDKALVHDFPSDAIGKAIPYGIYHMAQNEAYLNVGRDHHTPRFAVASIRRWWTTIGRAAYPRAAYPHSKEATHHCRRRWQQQLPCSILEEGDAWKKEMQEFSDVFDLVVYLAHIPPGTSKWNKIEHREVARITKGNDRPGDASVRRRTGVGSTPRWVGR